MSYGCPRQPVHSLPPNGTHEYSWNIIDPLWGHGEERRPESDALTLLNGAGQGFMFSLD